MLVISLSLLLFLEVSWSLPQVANYNIIIIITQQKTLTISRSLFYMLSDSLNTFFKGVKSLLEVYRKG